MFTRRNNQPYGLHERIMALIVAIIAALFLVFTDKAPVQADIRAGGEKVWTAAKSDDAVFGAAEEQAEPSPGKNRQAMNLKGHPLSAWRELSGGVEKSALSPDAVMIPGCILLLVALILAKDRKKE